MENSKKHWEKIYDKKSDTDVSWFQEKPDTSLRLIKKYAPNKKNIPISDIGGGNSVLALELINNGYSNICVLDISAKALDRNRKRIRNTQIKWIESDILKYNDLDDIIIWHDRAVLHFLINEKDIHKYVQIASKSIITNGYLILGTFSESGPDSCSGLPITKYSESTFKKFFGRDFDLIECFEEIHTTPFNTKQNFIWCVLIKKGEVFKT